MMDATRQQRIEKAGDDCRDNAHQTAVEKLGVNNYRALSFNEKLYADDTETLAQASYFADENDVTRAEVLAYLNLGETE